MGEDVADADVSGERDEVPSTSVAEADTLAGELKAKVQISRRRPDFTLPAMHRDLRLSSHAPLRESSGEGGVREGVLRVLQVIATLLLPRMYGCVHR